MAMSLVQHNMNPKTCWLKGARQGKGSIHSMAFLSFPMPHNSLPKFGWGDVLGREMQLLAVGRQHPEHSWPLSGALTAPAVLTWRIRTQTGFKPSQTIFTAYMFNPHTASTQFLRLYHFPEFHSPMLLRFQKGSTPKSTTQRQKVLSSRKRQAS